MYSVETFYILKNGKKHIDNTSIIEQLINLTDTYNGEWTANDQGAEGMFPRIVKDSNNYYFYCADDLCKFLKSLKDTDIKIEFIHHYYTKDFENYSEIFNNKNNNRYDGEDYDPKNELDFIDEEQEIIDICLDLFM